MCRASVLTELHFPAQRSHSTESQTKSESRWGEEVTDKEHEQWGKKRWRWSVKKQRGRMKERLHGGMGSGNLREVTAPSLCSSLEGRTYELWDGWRGVSERVWQQWRRLSMFQWVQSDSFVSYTVVCVFTCARVTIRGKMVVSVCEDGTKMHKHT